MSIPKESNNHRIRDGLEAGNEFLFFRNNITPIPISVRTTATNIKISYEIVPSTMYESRSPNLIVTVVKNKRSQQYKIVINEAIQIFFLTQEIIKIIKTANLKTIYNIPKTIISIL
jgi:hypothetical protein